MSYTIAHLNVFERNARAKRVLGCKDYEDPAEAGKECRRLYDFTGRRFYVSPSWAVDEQESSVG